MNNQKINYRAAKERFTNPYNFVSINQDVLRSEPRFGILSGKIACELETLTSLFIPNTTNCGTFSKDYGQSYDFFSYEDYSDLKDLNISGDFARPIIPGSSLRGAIRSAYEAATNGCMSTCDDENTLYRRTIIPSIEYGILEKDKHSNTRVLYEATKKEWLIGNRGNHQTGEIMDGGIYLRGEDSPGGKNKKKYDSIMHYKFKDDKKIIVERFPEDGREWERFVEVWRLYQGRKGPIKGVNQHTDHSGYKGYLNAKAIPVYYKKLERPRDKQPGNEDFYYMSPAAMTKEVFSRTLKDLLKEQGGHDPCSNSHSLCSACALFGMIGTESLASRLMFKDAEPVVQDSGTSQGYTDWSTWYDDVCVLPILNSPKVTATEFYMEDVDGAAYFNYDYFVNYERGERDEYKHVRTYLPSPKLRGRKFYWHKKEGKKDVTIDNRTVSPKQRTQIRSVRKEKTFKFDVLFDRLSQNELETLLWVLTFGDHNTTYAHKLGHGKPVGYGSVRITRAEVELISLSNALVLHDDTTKTFKPKKPDKLPIWEDNPDTDNESLAEYLRMTDYSKAPDNVKYPVALDEKNDKNGYVWFGINKKIRDKDFNPIFNCVLPTLCDDDISLPQYEVGEGDSGGNRKEIVFADSKKSSVHTTKKSAKQIRKESSEDKLTTTLECDKLRDYHDMLKSMEEK
ncbi:MAG: TIGR03986 family CRISPR-associated RAMP protein [Peptococcaceae bacterium]|nr:TIGR03986 family CRISPR-associated RAMP protein [Peptococcaceae bacterium]